MDTQFYVSKQISHGYNLLPIIDFWYCPPSQNVFNEHMIEISFKWITFDCWFSINI